MSGDAPMAPAMFEFLGWYPNAIEGFPHGGVSIRRREPDGTALTIAVVELSPSRDLADRQRRGLKELVERANAYAEAFSPGGENR